MVRCYHNNYLENEMHKVCKDERVSEWVRGNWYALCQIRGKLSIYKFEMTIISDIRMHRYVSTKFFQRSQKTFWNDLLETSHSAHTRLFLTPSLGEQFRWSVTIYGYINHHKLFKNSTNQECWLLLPYFLETLFEGWYGYSRDDRPP